MNSIRRMHELMNEILKWICVWEKKASYGGRKAIVNLGGSAAVMPGEPVELQRRPNYFSTCESLPTFQ